IGQTSTVAPDSPLLFGNNSAFPESVILPLSGTMSVVAGAAPLKNLYISPKETAEVAAWTWVESGIDTFVAPVIERPGGDSGPLVAHSASVDTPPGGDVAVRPSMFT